MTMHNILHADFVSEIEIEPMMAHLAEFSRWQKLAGTAEEATSLEYVRRQLDSYGLSTTILHHEAFISLPDNAFLVLGGDRISAITHSMALATPNGGLTREVVDLGLGTIADFDAANLQDRIVLIDGMATPEMARRCRIAQVAGQIHISPHDHLHEMCLSPVWGNPDVETFQELPTNCAITISHQDGKMIRDRLSKMSKLSVTIHADVDTGWRKTPILIADLKAQGAKDDAPFILFSGHHDTWYEGVMDNGSANSTMLEIARCLVTKRNAMQRHLRLCFWSGHSQGRYSGSAWFADQYWHELERNCAVHVNVDSTGGSGNTLLSRAPAATELSALAQEAIFSHSGQNHEGMRLARNSDQSFWGIGVPSMFGILSCQPTETPGVRNSLGWWWHTPNDKIEQIDPELLLRDTRIYAHAVGRLLFDDILPLDLHSQVSDLVAELAKIEITTECGIPVDALRAEAENLKSALSTFQSERPKNTEACLDWDRALMRVSRELVPLDYTTGDRYRHDPALPQPKWPSLEALRSLAREELDTPAFLLRRGPAIRTANRILSHLRRARRQLHTKGSDG